MSYTCKAQFRLKLAFDIQYVSVYVYTMFFGDVGWDEQSRHCKVGRLFYLAKTAAV